MSITPATQILHDDGAQALVDQWKTKRGLERDAAAAAIAGTLTGAQIDAILLQGDEIDTAAEVFRRRFYPNRARVVVALGMVCTVSATGRQTRIVFDPERSPR